MHLGKLGLSPDKTADGLFSKQHQQEAVVCHLLQLQLPEALFLCSNEGSHLKQCGNIAGAECQPHIEATECHCSFARAPREQGYISGGGGGGGA